MSFKEFYLEMEEKWYKFIDKLDAMGLPAHAITSAVDRVIPSFVLFLLLVLVVIVLIIYFALPSYQTVTITFKQDGFTLQKDFNFVVLADGKSFDGFAKNGVATLKLPKTDIIEISNVGLNEFKPKRTSFSFAENISVPLLKIYQNIPITLYFYANESALNKEATASLSCSDAEVPDEYKTISVSEPTVDVELPENCGTLTISASTDGFKPLTTTCESTSCMIKFDSVNTQPNDSGEVDYATGNIKIYVKDAKSNPLEGVELQVFDSRDMQTPYDIGTTNEVGVKQFFNLPVGSYVVFANKEGYLNAKVDLEVKDNQETETTINLSEQSLGQVFFKFKDESGQGLQGKFVLRNKDKEIVHRALVDSNGMVLVPIYSYDSYYFDFEPSDTNLMPFSAKEVKFEATSNLFEFTVKKKQLFNITKVNIKVVDDADNPVKGAKVFVKDSATGFELLSYKLPLTDENGYTYVFLEKGMYNFRAFDGITEGISESITILPSEAGEVPEVETTILLPYGYGAFKLKVKDEFDQPLGFAKVSFYRKPALTIGDQILNAQGTLNYSFKAGRYVYFRVEAENYLPFVSESRFIMATNPWDANVVLYLDQEKNPEVKFLGVYDSLGGKRIYNLEAGKTYYVGYDLFIYSEPDVFAFEFETGQNDIVDKDKLFITNVYTSADADYKYRDKEKENNTEADAKIVRSIWNNPKKGVYRVFYKIQIRNSSSVKMYDPISFSWRLYTEDDDLPNMTQTNDLLVGGKSICSQDSFCARVSVLDLEEQLYVDPFTEYNYLLTPNKDYEVEFDLINGLDGVDGQLENARLQIFNALSESESYETVKNNTALRSFIRLNSYGLEGPITEEHSPLGMEEVNRYGVFVPDYPMVKFYKNKYLHGKLNITPVSDQGSYVNFVVIDSDRKRVVRGKPALSLMFKPSTAKDINVRVFPEVLAPGLAQSIEVFVSDDSGIGVADAKVSVKIKHPTDLAYSVYSGCLNKKTNTEGKAECRISASDLTLGTYFQVIVEKEGYKTYYHKDFTPDVYVKDNFLDVEPETLNVNLIYPKISESTADIVFTNNAPVDLEIDSIDFELDSYSQQYSNYLDVATMHNYLLNSFKERKIVGKQSNLTGEAKTPLDDFFKAKLSNSASDLDKELKLSGLVKTKFKAQAGTPISYDVPFTINVVSDGYPTNADTCLNISFDHKGFVADGPGVLSVPFNFADTCVIEIKDKVYPVKFDKLYVVVDVKKGSLGLGQFSSLQIQPLGFSSDSIVIGIPKAIASGFETDIEVPELEGILGFMPTGKRGTTTYSIKLVGFVNTSKGVKRVESKEETFNVSVLNIDDCIKIYNEKGDEISYLEFKESDAENSVNLENDVSNIVVKNICKDVPLKIRFCYDNSSDRSQGCGKLTGTPREGLEFTNSDITSMQGVDLVDEKTIGVKRPGVPGAYAIDVWAKLPDQFSMKRVKFLKVNVKTSFNSGLFSDNPFLEVSETSTGDKNSDTLLLYNTWIGPSSGVSIMQKNTFAELINKEVFKKGGGVKDFKDSHEEGMFYGGLSATVLGAAAITVAALLPTSSTLTVGLFTITLATGPGSWAIGLGVAGAVAVAAGLTTFIASFFGADMDQKDDEEILNFPLDDKVLSVKMSDNIDLNLKESNNKNLVGHVLGYTGENKFFFVKHYKEVEGQYGGTWDDAIKFTVTCPPDYEVYEKGIIYLDKGDETTIFDDCSWKDSAYKVKDDKRSVTFYPICYGGSSPFGNEFTFRSYVLVPCKLKSGLWGRTQNEGVSSGHSDTGLLKIKFTDVDFSSSGLNCNEEWCFKTYTLNINGINGHKKDYFRVAFHNKKKQEIKLNFTGIPCTDATGAVIGFTGPDAKPKIEYNWKATGNNAINKNFCAKDEDGKAKVYCDATQFTIANFKRIINGNDKLKENFEDKISCPSLPPQNGFKKHIRVDDIDNIFGFKEPEVALDDQNNVVLAVPLKPEDVPLNEIPTISGFGSNVVSTDCNIIVMERNEQANIARIRPYCTLVLKENFNAESYEAQDEPYRIYKGDITLSVNLSNWEKSKLAKIHVDLNYVKTKSKCLLSRPSTKAINGKMMMFYFIDNLSSDDENKLYQIQDIFHYQAYLMDDGFTTDFLNDFKENCNTFLSCPDNFDVFSKLIEEGKFKVINLYDNSSKTNGPGLYNIHNVILYPAIGSGSSIFNLYDAEIIVYIEKVKTPEQDYAFYYMPIDGKVGINSDTISRQGYGVDFTGDVVKVFDNVNDSLLTGLSTDSNPLRTINVSKEYSFLKANKSNRGMVLQLTQYPNYADLTFIPNLKPYVYKYNMKNENVDVDTALYYRLSYNGELLNNNNLTLPWYVKPKDKDEEDFTGQLLVDSYPKIAMRATEKDGIGNYDEYAKIFYPSTNVVKKTNYDIYTIIYGLDGDSFNFKTITKNLEKDNVEKINTYVGSYDAINNVFNAIDNNVLCIGGNSVNTFVFYNENKILGDN